MSVVFDPAVVAISGGLFLSTKKMNRIVLKIAFAESEERNSFHEFDT